MVNNLITVNYIFHGSFRNVSCSRTITAAGSLITFKLEKVLFYMYARLFMLMSANVEQEK